MNEPRAVAICPYCFHRQLISVEYPTLYKRPKVVTCDLEEGGCDKHFVAYTRVELFADTAKIEGEE